jgi:prephenate dehydrogenase
MAVERLAILGLGLMGGSLGLAARERVAAGTVVAYARREATRALAIEQGAVDAVFASPGEAVKDADLVVICTPILVIPEVLASCASQLKPGCIVTDVGSTKAELHEAADRLLDGTEACFVGSHPMAGSDQTGLEVAREDLYQGAVVVVTQGKAPSASVEVVQRFWETVGASVVMLEPDAHDRMVARTSHLPHLVASLLVRSVYRDERERVERFCGTGFRDTTRIAAGSEDIWHDIVKSNRTAVADELAAFREELDRVRVMLDSADFEGIRSFLAHSRELRRGE